MNEGFRNISAARTVLASPLFQRRTEGNRLAAELASDMFLKPWQVGRRRVARRRGPRFSETGRAPAEENGVPQGRTRREIRGLYPYKIENNQIFFWYFHILH